MSKTLARVITAALVPLTLAGCGHSDELKFRIYDPRHEADVEITTPDLLRKSVKIEKTPNQTASVYFRLSDNGEEKFRRLTEVLARRGRRRHALQRMAIEVNDKVYARPAVDYNRPDAPAIELGMTLAGLNRATARQLFNELRNG